VDACFGLFGDSANLDARLLQGLRRTYQGSEIILDASMVLLADDAQVDARFGLFRHSANLDAT
jgi:hypothetical protein